MCSGPSLMVDSSSHTVTANCMKSLNLKEIRSVTDFQKIANSVSCYRHQETINASKTKSSSKYKTSANLYEYQRLLGYPNPHNLQQLSRVLECLFGVSIVSQLVFRRYQRILDI